MRKQLLVILFLFSFLSPLSPVLAQGMGKQADAPVELINPIGGSEKNPTGLVDTRVIFGNAVQIVLGFLGSITLVVFVYGGYLWLTSAGSSDKVQQGTKTMVYAVIGLFIIFGAYGILTTVLEGITGKSLGNGGGTPAAGTLPSAQDAAPDSPSEFNCNDLVDRQACHDRAAQGCTWVVFFLPGGGGDQLTACTNNEEKATMCAQFNTACASQAGGDENVLLQCAEAEDSCKL